MKSMNKETILSIQEGSGIYIDGEKWTVERAVHSVIGDKPDEFYSILRVINNYDPETLMSIKIPHQKGSVYCLKDKSGYFTFDKKISLFKEENTNQ